MKRRLLMFALITVAMAVSGCSTIPISGPVVAEPRPAVDDEQARITVVAEPPAQGARKDMIIRGFLTAMASYGTDYSTARQYLTADAARSWDPTAQVLIYASNITPQVTGDQAALVGTLIGHLRSDGSFDGSQETSWSLDLGLVEENGQWRISTPPDGLAMSQYMFSQSFMRIGAYFFPDAGTTLVPESRYVQPGAWTRTKAAELVLAGPSQWLSTIAHDQARSVPTLAGEVTLSATGTADIPLSDRARDLTLDQATRLAIEMAATMRNIAGVSRVRLVNEGQPLPLRDAGLDGSLPVSVVDLYDAFAQVTTGSLMAAQNDVIVSLADLSQPVGVEGDWGATPRAVSSLAIRQTPFQIAAVSEEGLLVGDGNGSESPTLLLEGQGILRPQYDQRGNIFAMANAVDGPELSVVTPETIVEVDTSSLAGMTVRAFQVSPDGRRVLLVREVDSPDGPVQELGVALIAHHAQIPTAILSWKPIRLAWEASDLRLITDVAWLGSSWVLVLASPDAGTSWGVFSTDLDASLELSEWGMRQDWAPVEIAVQTTTTSPRIIVRSGDDGAVWTYQDSYSWSRSSQVVSAIAFSV